jgi:hypothetical protein
LCYAANLTEKDKILFKQTLYRERYKWLYYRIKTIKKMALPSLQRLFIPNRHILRSHVIAERKRWL